jgi:hypothetical protein
MSAIATDVRNVLLRRLTDAPLADVVGLLHSLEPQPKPAASPIAMPSFVKLSGAGLQLQDDAEDWVAVKDRTTGLIWSRHTINDERYIWTEAKEAVADVQLCGWSDWRLPTRKELLSIVDDTRVSPAIDIRFFDCKSDWYWTSTEVARSSDCAWFVYFSYGSSSWGGRGYGGFVRAVRVGQ